MRLLVEDDYLFTLHYVHYNSKHLIAILTLCNVSVLRNSTVLHFITAACSGTVVGAAFGGFFVGVLLTAAIASCLAAAVFCKAKREMIAKAE